MGTAEAVPFPGVPFRRIPDGGVRGSKPFAGLLAESPIIQGHA
jgi:hypothetical protein